MAEYIDLDTPLEVKVARGSTFESYTSTLRELLDVNHIPYTAADVIERKHGKWVGYPNSFKYEHVYDRGAIVCPFCEESWNIVDNDTERFNYCPNCGARMDGEDDGT